LERPIAVGGLDGRLPSERGQFVVAAGGPLLTSRDALFFPPGTHVTLDIESAEDGIDRAAG
jgi:hypothetical protein